MLLRVMVWDVDRDFAEEGARFEVERKRFFGVWERPSPVGMSGALVRVRSAKRTFDEESMSISQCKFFEGARAREDEVCHGVENFAVPSELEVQFGIAKG